MSVALHSWVNLRRPSLCWQRSPSDEHFNKAVEFEKSPISFVRLGYKSKTRRWFSASLWSQTSSINLIIAVRHKNNDLPPLSQKKTYQSQQTFNIASLLVTSTYDACSHHRDRWMFQESFFSKTKCFHRKEKLLSLSISNVRLWMILIWIGKSGRKCWSEERRQDNQT